MQISNFSHFSDSNFKVVFDKTSHEISKRALELYGQAGNDISLNRPLTENLMAVLTCISLGHHALICGKPGTSKTLALEIACSVLARDLSNDEVLRHFKKARFSKFYGSMNTTSEGLRNKFLSVTAEYLKNPESDEVMVLVFDEIGLAELAQDNPNKVLHSYLDSGSEDKLVQLRPYLLEQMSKMTKYSNTNESEKDIIIENIARKNVHFVGVSNWRLDASKSNRMIFVARGKMAQDDLIATGKRMYESHIKEDSSFTNYLLSSVYAESSIIVE